MDSILTARLEVPYWCSFRVPYAVNVHFTYPVPPLTTLQGVVAAAMGYPADYTIPLQDLRFGIALEKEGSLMESYSSIIKWDRRYPGMRTLVMKQKLYHPVYRMYAGGDKDYIEKIAGALEHPAFPLFLGESDDVLEVKDVQVYSPAAEESDTLDCCVPAVYGRPRGNGVTVVHLPVEFKSNKRGAWTGVEYRDFYVAGEVQLDEPVQAYKAGDRRVVLWP